MPKQSVSPSKNSKKPSKDKKKGSKAPSPSPARATRAKSARAGNRSTTPLGSLEGKATNSDDILPIFDQSIGGLASQPQSQRKGPKPILADPLGSVRESAPGNFRDSPKGLYVGQGLANAEFSLKDIRSSFDLSCSFNIEDEV